MSLYGTLSAVFSGGVWAEAPSGLPAPPPSSDYDATVEGSSAFGNLVAWWKLAGSPVVDTQGNIANGTVNGAVTFVSDPLPDDGDTVADFDGATGYISFIDDVDLHLTAGAIHCAINIDSFPTTGQFKTFIAKEGSGLVEQDFVFTLFNNAGTPELRFQAIMAGAAQRVVFAGITLGRHWVTVNFGNTLALELFVDGISRASNPSYTSGVNSNTRALTMGAADFGSGLTQFFDGRMKHVQIYNRRLTVGEISALSPTFASAGEGLSSILTRTPTLYWPMLSGTATDASGNGLNGTINGTPAGSSSAGIDLGGTADISLTHSSLFETDPAPTTVDQDSYSEVGVTAYVTVNTLVNNTALISKCDDPDAFGLAWYVEAMANGSVRFHYRSHRHNDLVIDAPAGTISIGTEFVLHMGLGYEGAWAAINGRMLWDGRKCPLHWYGDDHRVRDIVAAGRNHGGSRKVNTNALRVGKIGASGTRGDITVRHVALFYRNNRVNQMTLGDAQAIAGSGSVSALIHPIWGASTNNVANGATAATVQAAIDSVNGAGGGTVKLAASGSYTWTTDVTVKGNVLLDLNGSTVTMSGATLLVGTNPTISSITDDGGDVPVDATSITGANIAAACAVGDCLVLIRHTTLDTVFGGTIQAERITEVFEVKRKVGSVVHFKQPSVRNYTSANRSLFRTEAGVASLWRWTPPRNLGVVNGTITKSGQRTMDWLRANFVLVQNLLVIQSSAAVANNHAIEVNEILECWSPGGFFVRNAATEGAGGGGHVYSFYVLGYARTWGLYGAEFYQGGIPGWHAISHAGSNALPGVDTKATQVELEYVQCKWDCAERIQQFDTHYDGSMRVRWIDCAVKTTATGVAGTAGSPGGGGCTADGYQIEILRMTVPTSPVGKFNQFRGQDGQYQCYVRNYAQRHPTGTSTWFTGNGRVASSTFVNLTRVHTGTPSVSGTPQVDHDGLNVFVNVTTPHPNGAATPIFQSDENSFSVGTTGASIFANWGTVISNFNPTRFSIQNDPAGGGGKCIRGDLPSSGSSASCPRDFAAVHNGGNDVLDIALEVEIYLSSPSPTVSGEDLKIARVAGHDWSSAASRTVVNDPSSSIDAEFQHGTKDEISAYSYYVNKPGSFGVHFHYGPAFSTNVWTKVRIECIGGRGAANGVSKTFVNGSLIGQTTGLQWHTNPSFGWRHVSLSIDSQALPSDYQVYIRNLKIFNITP